ncbi:MAG: tetratricopeptide repeat protein [Candidatus Binataceae bacterium]|nr:tetratricopeptide repeat protein [Candidatus Binataceae bacterium]
MFIAAPAGLCSDRVKQGKAALKRCDYGQAVSLLSQAIRLNPKDAEAWVWRGQAYDKEKDLENSIADYTEALHLKPESAGVYVLRGDAYRHNREYPQALDDYDIAIKLKPHSADAFTSRGVYFFDRRDFNSAISDFDQALQFDPNHASAIADRRLAYACRISWVTCAAWKGDTFGWLALAFMGAIFFAFGSIIIAGYRTRQDHIDRAFRRDPNGQYDFYPRSWGKGYVVPDTSAAQRLRRLLQQQYNRSNVFSLAMCAVLGVLLFEGKFSPRFLNYFLWPTSSTRQRSLQFSE